MCWGYNGDEPSDENPRPEPGGEENGTEPSDTGTETPDVQGSVDDYPAHLTEISPGEVAYTVTVYWEQPSSKARALCRHMSFTDNGSIHMDAGPMGNNYTVRGASCDADIPELTVVYN